MSLGCQVLYCLNCDWFHILLSDNFRFIRYSTTVLPDCQRGGFEIVNDDLKGRTMLDSSCFKVGNSHFDISFS